MPQDEAGAAPLHLPALQGLPDCGYLRERVEDNARGSRICGDPYPHTLFEGPAGTGRGQAARAIARCLVRRTVDVDGAELGNGSVAYDLLQSLGVGDVLLVTDLHAADFEAQEVLGLCMRGGGGSMSLRLGDTVATRCVPSTMPEATVIATSTPNQGLWHRLRDAFEERERLHLREPDLCLSGPDLPGPEPSNDEDHVPSSVEVVDAPVEDADGVVASPSTEQAPQEAESATDDRFPSRLRRGASHRPALDFKPSAAIHTCGSRRSALLPLWRWSKEDADA